MRKFTVLLCLMLLCACSQKKQEQEASIPEISKIIKSSEITTLECYYHNVAKGTKPAGKGIWNIGEKERTFWQEYTGKASISFKSDLIEITQDNTNITIKLPEPVFAYSIVEGSWSPDRIVKSSDAFFNKNPITTDDTTKAIHEAQKEMKKSMEGNPSLIMQAKDQAKDLIANHINQLGEATNCTYNVTWVE